METATFFAFNGHQPVVDPSAFVHPRAVVIGHVYIGPKVYVGPGAVLRGDFGGIEVGEGANIQENCVIHMFPGVTVRIHPSAHIGHGAIIHGAEIGENSLIGMGAVLMDDVCVGKESIVGALSFLPAKFQVPDRKVVVGNPARIIKDVSDQMIAWKTEGTAIYQALPQACQNSMHPVQPLRSKPAHWEPPTGNYALWADTRSK